MQQLEKNVGKRVRKQYRPHPFPPESRRGDYIKFGEYLRDRIFGGDPINAEGKSILEAGCGTGVMITDIASVLPEARYVCIDFSEPSISIAQRYQRMHENDPDKPHLKNMGFHVADFLDSSLGKIIPLDEGFDLIESWGVIHHTEDPSKTFSKLAALLKPEGWIRIGVYGDFGNRQRREQIEEMKRLTDGLRIEEKISLVYEFMETSDYNPNLCRPPLYAPNRCPTGIKPATPPEIVDEFLHEHERHIRLSELVEWFSRDGIQAVELTNWDNNPISLRIEDRTENPVVIKRFRELGKPSEILTPEQAEILDYRVRPYWIGLFGKKI